MPKKEFIMRGRLESARSETLNFSGKTPGYAYKLVEFHLYPADDIGEATFEYVAAITAGKTAVHPQTVDFNNEGLIACTYLSSSSSTAYPTNFITSINDTFLITQNLILMIVETSGAHAAANWQCKFKSVKMTGPEEAATNYKQFAISDE